MPQNDNVREAPTGHEGRILQPSIMYQDLNSRRGRCALRPVHDREAELLKSEKPDKKQLVDLREAFDRLFLRCRRLEAEGTAAHIAEAGEEIEAAWQEIETDVKKALAPTDPKEDPKTETE